MPKGHDNPRGARPPEADPGNAVRRDLPLVAGSVAVARTVVGDALRSAGFIGDLDAAVLLTSEVVTNAVRHGRPPLTLAVAADATTARVEVSDGDRTRLPAIHDGGLTAPDGRGLRIVDRLARDWGVDVGRSGKTVWFTAR